MSTLSDLVYAQGRSSAEDVEWLHRLAGDGQLLADLAFADIVLWVPTSDDSFVAVAHTRPSGAATLFYRDIVGDRVRPQWRTQVRDAFATGRIVDSASPDWFEETATRVRAVPVVRVGSGDGRQTIGVLTRHTNLGEARTPSRAEVDVCKVPSRTVSSAPASMRPVSDSDLPEGSRTSTEYTPEGTDIGNGSAPGRSGIL